MEPPQSWVVVLATLLERVLALSVYIGVRGMIFVASWYVLYIGMAATLDLFGWFHSAYPPLSLNSDPFFVIGGAVVGLFVVQAAGSLVLYHLLVGVEDAKSQFSVLMGFISLGFGGALLRVTVPTAVEMVVTFL